MTPTDVPSITAALSPEIMRSLGLFTIEELEELATTRQSEPMVEGLIGARSVVALIGTWGIGKSPFLVQLGLAVAAGLPFLGHPTRPARVLWINSEPGAKFGTDLANRVARHLGLPAKPDTFRVWTPTESRSRAPDAVERWAGAWGDEPKLVLIDPLALYNPEAETRTDFASRQLNKWKALGQHNTSVVFTHHTRKPANDGQQHIHLGDADDLQAWFDSARGAGALVADSDTRIGLEPSVVDQTLLMRGFERGVGEFGPLGLERVVDQEIGEYLGYAPVVDRAERLSYTFGTHATEQAAFLKLPVRFSYKEAKHAFGKGDSTTAYWLRRAETGGLLQKLGRTQGYQKLIE